MKNITKEWFYSAEQDIETIKSILENELLTGVVAFHAQQSIEKSFKAVFEEYSMDQLDELYIESRYPGELGLLPNGKPSEVWMIDILTVRLSQ